MTNIKQSSDIPITQKMLYLVRDEMNSKFLSLEHTLKGHGKQFASIDSRFDVVDRRFEQIDKRFEEVDSRFEQIDKRFDQVDKRFEHLDAKIDAKFELLSASIQKVSADVHRFMAIIEEQNNCNKYVMDGILNLFERQDRLEKYVHSKI